MVMSFLIAQWRGVDPPYKKQQRETECRHNEVKKNEIFRQTFLSVILISALLSINRLAISLMLFLIARWRGVNPPCKRQQRDRERQREKECVAE
jgi:hypothetical protein